MSFNHPVSPVVLSALVACIVFMQPVRSGEVQRGIGRVKIGSRPAECVVRFRKRIYQKKDPVLTVDGVPAGRYSVWAGNEENTALRSIVVYPGRTAMVFLDLKKAPPSPAAAPGASSSFAAPSSDREPERVGLTGQTIPDADIFYEAAETQRKSINPFTKATRYKRAERLYRQILQRWPESNKTELCHFRLGMIYESMFYQDFDAAITEYRQVLELNRQTPLPARFRIAEIHEGEDELPEAIEWYRRVAAESPDPALRPLGERKIEALQKELKRRREAARAAGLLPDEDLPEKDVPGPFPPSPAMVRPQPRPPLQAAPPIIPAPPEEPIRLPLTTP